MKENKILPVAVQDMAVLSAANAVPSRQQPSETAASPDKQAETGRKAEVIVASFPCIREENDGQNGTIDQIPRAARSSIKEKGKYKPVKEEQLLAYREIFDPGKTKEDIIAQLGKMKNGKAFFPQLALYSLQSAYVLLTNRNKVSILTPDEAAIYEQLQGYMAERAMNDEEFLVHLEQRLGRRHNHERIDRLLHPPIRVRPKRKIEKKASPQDTLPEREISVIALGLLSNPALIPAINKPFRRLNIPDPETLSDIIESTDFGEKSVKQVVKTEILPALDRLQELLKSPKSTNILDRLLEPGSSEGENKQWQFLCYLKTLNEKTYPVNGIPVSGIDYLKTYFTAKGAQAPAVVFRRKIQ